MARGGRLMHRRGALPAHLALYCVGCRGAARRLFPHPGGPYLAAVCLIRLACRAIRSRGSHQIGSDRVRCEPRDPSPRGAHVTVAANQRRRSARRYQRPIWRAGAARVNELGLFSLAIGRADRERKWATLIGGARQVRSRTCGAFGGRARAARAPLILYSRCLAALMVLSVARRRPRPRRQLPAAGLIES